ncbi:MAG: class I SAM-dependent DNA methyltransferase [Bacteroidales bacterium]|nr:class I SAM-dependent DNA methyltransferase [Bacteroidales bacterium]
MAKKTKSYSQVQATEALEKLSQQGTSAQEFVYDLLRIFAGYGDGQIRRTKDGPGNLAKDGETVLIKNLVAYRQTPVNTLDGDCSKMYDVINAMRDDAKIGKKSPRLYITSNGVHVVAYDPKENDWYENSIELLWKDFEFFTPLAGIEKIQFTEEAEADVKSAELMAKLFDDIRRYNNIRAPQTVHALNVFMSRLLFCFFAEDTGLFPGENLFTNTLKTHTKEDGTDLAEFIDRAFLAMSTTEAAVLDSLPNLYKVFPYVNGGLFKERFPIPTLSRRARTLIINCGGYNWKEINPDIFGSMIQAVITPEQRAGLGMHYTSVPNIEKVIRPLFLDTLEEEFEAARNEARDKIAKNIHSERATQRLRNLLGRMSRIKFFDPACGSGNFLIISYKRVRELEIRIWKELRELSKTAFLPVPCISLTQFYGIELDEYACDTATLSLWLAEHQMNVKFQEELYVLPETLPLKPSGHIVCGNACRLDWNTVCPHTPEDEVYIMGNPPYLGARLQDDSQKEDCNSALGDIQGHNELDYIASWFWKGTNYIANSNATLAFVTTNSISQGEQVNILWNPILSKNVHIFFAHQSFRWSNNAKYNAAVTCSIIGLSAKPCKKRLFAGSESRIVENINPYLIGGSNTIITGLSKPIGLVPEMSFGSMPNDGGYLLLEKSEKEDLIKSDANCSRFIHRIYGSLDFIRGEERYCIWIEEQDKDHLPLPVLKRVKQVETVRSESKRSATNKLAAVPWRFGEVRYKNSEAIIVPRHSSERRTYIPIGYVDRDIIIADSAFAIYDAEKWLFALLTSKMHNLWVRAVSGSLETRIRYSATLCYNTFPFPKLTEAQKEELERLAKNVFNMRDENYDLTPAKMYNPETMPDELREAHHQLDLAVERIYRPEPFTSDEERLEHLFKLYAKMTKK